tara:strand:+ start:200 stop:1543 length:1344 start_codon:yes stop_codon:yes gene_type:complete
MEYINYVKQAPVQGVTGLWGGTQGALTSGSITYEAGTFTGDRGVFVGQFAAGWPTPNPQPMQYINITSTGNAATFGNYGSNQYRHTTRCASNGSRGLIGGGQKQHPGWDGSNEISYITTSSTGNASDFGNLSTARQCGGAGSNGERAVFSGGNKQLDTGSGFVPTYSQIDYVTIDTTGNATDFGDMDRPAGIGGDCGDGIYACWAGGRYSPYSGGAATNRIERVNVFTTGNGVDFGNLTSVRYNGPTGIHGATRGCYGGGTTPSSPWTSNEIQYITIQSPGNTTDFGDLSQQRQQMGGVSNLTRGVFGGGTSPQNVDTMDYITIANTGNATDFGNLDKTLIHTSGLSGSASDEKLKDNITPIEDSISKVSSISGNTFNWNEKSEFEGKLDTGVIAQEVEKLGLPGIVEDQESGYKIVHYYKLVPLLIESVKELSSRVQILEQTIIDK